MNIDFTKQENAVRYLLGELSADEQAAVEEQFFIDEDFSRFLDATETDLIDEYVRGELTPSQKQNFERRFLISERRRERLHSAQTLQTEFFSRQQNVVTFAKFSFWERVKSLFPLPKPLLAGGLMAILLFVVLGGIWFVRQGSDQQIAQNEGNQNNGTLPVLSPSPKIKPTETVMTNQTLSDSNKNELLQIKKKTNNNLSPPELPNRQKTLPAQPLPAFTAFVLLPPTRSSAEKPVLNIPAAVKVIRLQIVHDNKKEFIKYRAEIRDNSNGDLILSRELTVTTATLQKPLNLRIRNGAIPSGSYELTLSGMTADGTLEEINYYNFFRTEKMNQRVFKPQTTILLKKTSVCFSSSEQVKYY